MKTRNILLSAGALIILIVLWIFFSTEAETSTDLTVSPTRNLFRVTVTATGELQAKNSIEIYGPRSAMRARIYNLKISKLVPEGTVVEKGDFVAELDKSEINKKIQDAELEIQKAESRYLQAKLDTALTLSKARDELVNLNYAMEEAELRMEESEFEAPSIQRQAQINYEKAVRNYERAKESYKTKVQQAEAKMSEAEVDLTQKQREYETFREVEAEFSITAPADGMVIYRREHDGRKITEGSSVSPWRPTVATLPDLTVMESRTFISEVDIQKIRTGLSVELGLDADPEKSLTGVVTDIANIGEERPNSDSKVFEVIIEVNETDSTLRPAMTTSNTIIADTVKHALTVPLECLHAEDSLSYVYRKAGSGVQRQEVRVGLVNEHSAIIEEGLTEEDVVYLSIPELSEELHFHRLTKRETG